MSHDAIVFAMKGFGLGTSLVTILGLMLVIFNREKRTRGKDEMDPFDLGLVVLVLGITFNIIVILNIP